MATKKIEVRDLRLAYGAREALKGVTFDVYQNEILAVIGPAQSGKTSLLEALYLVATSKSFRAEKLRELVQHCQFNDCTHTHEPGCAVRRALDEGKIHPERYESYLRLRSGKD